MSKKKKRAPLFNVADYLDDPVVVAEYRNETVGRSCSWPQCEQKAKDEE